MCTNICFWYIPPRMRGLPETDEWWQELGKVFAFDSDIQAALCVLYFNKYGKV